MDIEKYIAGKAKNLSGIELHGDSTLLIKWPDGFDPTTGAALAPKEQGFQPADIAGMKATAEDAVTAAESELEKAQQRVSMFDDLLGDIEPFMPQIEKNLAAASKKP